MKTIGIILLTFSLFRCGAQSNENANQMDILIVTDDRNFNREAFFKMFDSFENLSWKEMARSTFIDRLATPEIKEYDAVVFYDMPETIVLSAEQKQNMLRFFEEGAPVVFLHHSLLSYREWNEFQNIIGGRFYNKSPLITEAGDTIQSLYEHDVRYKVRIADRNHPVTRGIEDFEILDETYNNYVVNSDVKVLLTTDHPSSGEALGWINTYGNSQIVFLINGHSETAYENPNYRQLVYNAIKWVVVGEE